MKASVISICLWPAAVLSSVVDRQLLSYASIPADAYVPATNTSSTLLSFLQSRPELSVLTSTLGGAGGFAQAFATAATWKYTFFAPSNAAFNNTGEYFSTFLATPKGKWWFGNLLQHHYVPNSALQSTAFNSSVLRFQTGSYLYVSGQSLGGQVILNNVSTVTEADLPVTNGIVHIIDRILDPSAQIFEGDINKVSQSFIAGSCSNDALPYC